MKSLKNACLAALLLAPVPAIHAEELTLLDAKATVLDDWTWSDASITAKDDLLAVTEINKQGDYGNTFVENYLPYLPSGLVQLDIAQVESGFYTLQILLFAGKTHIGTIDPVKDAREPGRREIRMADLDVPAECDTILLKLWVGGAEGATTLLNNLTYTVQMPSEDIRSDATFGKAEAWEANDVRLSHADDSATATLADGKSFGSVLYQPLLPRSDEGRLLVHAVEVTGGTLTLQIVAFGPEGRYIDSVDAIPSFTSGWRGISLNRIAWPEGTTHFRVKLWLGGTGGASAVLDRLLILAR